jgi:hypothetical protein
MYERSLYRVTFCRIRQNGETFEDDMHVKDDSPDGAIEAFRLWSLEALQKAGFEDPVAEWERGYKILSVRKMVPAPAHPELTAVYENEPPPYEDKN